MSVTWDESYPPSVLHPALPPTGATAGTPGAWTPAGSDVPSSVAEANALGLSLGAAWTTGQYVVLDNASQTHAYWDGTKFVSGEAPAPVIPATGATAGTPGSWTPASSTPPANLAASSGVFASPATVWGVGQYVVLGDSSHTYWTSSAWAAGEAPAAVEGASSK